MRCTATRHDKEKSLESPRREMGDEIHNPKDNVGHTRGNTRVTRMLGQAADTNAGGSYDSDKTLLPKEGNNN